jgi:hypothetical protein
MKEMNEENEYKFTEEKKEIKHEEVKPRKEEIKPIHNSLKKQKTQSENDKIEPKFHEANSDKNEIIKKASINEHKTEFNFENHVESNQVKEKLEHIEPKEKSESYEKKDDFNFDEDKIQINKSHYQEDANIQSQDKADPDNKISNNILEDSSDNRLLESKENFVNNMNKENPVVINKQDQEDDIYNMNFDDKEIPDKNEME